MANGNLNDQERVLLLVASAARTVTQKVSIPSTDPLQVIPNLGGPLKLADVGIADSDRAQIFKDALLKLTPDTAKAKVRQLNITPDDKFSALRETLELILLAADEEAGSGTGEPNS